jgi:hypothetical protein
MENKLLKILTNPNELYYKSGLATPTRGYISDEARRKAKAKRKKKRK